MNRVSVSKRTVDLLKIGESVRFDEFRTKSKFEGP